MGVDLIATDIPLLIPEQAYRESDGSVLFSWNPWIRGKLPGHCGKRQGWVKIFESANGLKNFFIFGAQKKAGRLDNHLLGLRWPFTWENYYYSLPTGRDFYSCL